MYGFDEAQGKKRTSCIHLGQRQRRPLPQRHPHPFQSGCISHSSWQSPLDFPIYCPFYRRTFSGNLPGHGREWTDREPMSLPVHPTITISQSINQLTNQSISLSVSQSINQWSELSVDRANRATPFREHRVHAVVPFQQLTDVEFVVVISNVRLMEHERVIMVNLRRSTHHTASSQTGGKLAKPSLKIRWNWHFTFLYSPEYDAKTSIL